MVEDTMFSGESKNIEYKVSLPDKSEKYMKTIVAFANTQGGKLIVGVDDKTHQIVGVENEVLFQLMDGIANIFSQMGLVEAWGSGIKRILNAAEAYGLSKPRFQEFDNMFRVELFRSSFPMTNGKESIGEASEVVWRTDLNDTQQKIIKLLSEDHQLSAVKLAEKIGVASRNIENNIKKLKEYGILIRHGSPKNGYWEIVDKDLQE